MAYYYKYNFTSPEVVYSTVKEELKSYLDTGAVDDLMFPTYLDKCLRKLGRTTYVIDEDILHINDFQAVPAAVWEADWVVHCKAVSNGETAFQYLAPYIFRVAINNSRLLKVENDHVTFRYRASDTGQSRTCTLAAEEFIRRFLQHVLPKGFVKVRHYGFLSVAQRASLMTLRQQLAPHVTAPLSLLQPVLQTYWYTPTALGEAMGRSESWFYVAAVGEEVIGFAQFMLREGRRGELTRIYVLPEWQRRGVGSHLLKAGLDALSTHGAEEVFAHVEKDNAKGTGFYERRGFRPVRAFSLEFPEQNLEMLEYALSLGAR